MSIRKSVSTAGLILLAAVFLLPVLTSSAVAAPEQSWYGSGSATLSATHPDLHWERLIRAAPWGKRAMPRGGLLDGQFYVMSGRAGMFRIYGDTWRSPDGVHWECMSRRPGWKRRAYPEVEFVQGTIVLMGGQNLTTFFNDVWRSQDKGKTWELVNASAPWDVRAGHHTTVIDGDIYLFAGGRNSFNRVFYNDLWVSDDQGATWEVASRVKPDKGSFVYRAPHDGEYWYAIRTVDARGAVKRSVRKVTG